MTADEILQASGERLNALTMDHLKRLVGDMLMMVAQRTAERDVLVEQWPKEPRDGT